MGRRVLHLLRALVEDVIGLAVPRGSSLGMAAEINPLMKNGPESQSGNLKEPRPPWSPTGIAVISLLLSPLAGGVLHALNYSRLGVPERRRLALFANLITGIAILFVPVFTTPLFSRLAAALLVAAYFYKSQESLFQAHRASGGRKASLLVPGCLSIVAALILGLILLFAE